LGPRVYFNDLVPVIDKGKWEGFYFAAVLMDKWSMSLDRYFVNYEDSYSEFMLELRAKVREKLIKFWERTGRIIGDANMKNIVVNLRPGQCPDVGIIDLNWTSKVGDRTIAMRRIEETLPQFVPEPFL
jgi:hypothetical protein